jgi:NitT/TauT family transport system substrate-binding protein
MMTAPSRSRLLRGAAALVAAALLVTGCGGDDPNPAGTGPAGEPEQVTLRVGDVLGTPAAFLEFAIQQGFFTEQNLDVQVEPNPGGAANIPGVAAGDFEIAGSNLVSVLLARSQGLGIQLVSAGTFGGDSEATDFAQILVRPDSDIRGPADLDGRSLAVNTLANIAEVTARASIENSGGGHENIDFVELGFPDMIPALLDGQVDAIFEIEPFVAIGLAQGLRPVIAPYAGTQPGLAIGSYFSSDEYIAEHPDVIDRFVAGVSAAGAYVAEHPDEFRTALVDLADLEPEVAQEVVIPAWGGPVDVPSVQLVGELMVRYQLIDQAPAVDEVVYQG